ncbi:MAG TPA: DUF4836 family protein, partial [Chitinophagaceae bacterium]|nr:DUF4836 family protein [Chitinophagaceae bacterium]
MKHPKITSLLCALALCVMLISCSSGDKSALPIPIDAGVVLNVDLESLSKKMSWNDIRSSEWFKSKMNSSSDSFMRKVMENPESTGIDLKDDVAFFTKQINSTESYFGLTGHLKDASAFEEFVTKASETNAKPTKEGDINYLTLPNEGIVSWNNNKFLVVGAQSSRISYMMDDSTAVPNAGSTDPKAYAKRLLTTKGDSLIGSDARYTNMLKDEADAHIWSNAEASTGAVLGSGMLSMLKLEKYLEGTVSTSTVNFENGKIVMNAKTYTNDEMMAIFKKYAGNKINTSMVERLPSTDVAAVLVANYKPDMLKDLLKLGGLDGLVNGYLGEMGLTLDEVLSASKGDMMFAVTDFKIQVRTNMDDEMKPVATQTP